MRRPLYSAVEAAFSIASVANSPRPVGQRPTREGMREVLLEALLEVLPAMADAARRLCRVLRFAPRHFEPRLHRHRRTQRVDAGAAGEGQPFDLFELVLGRVAGDAQADRHL